MSVIAYKTPGFDPSLTREATMASVVVTTSSSGHRAVTQFPYRMAQIRCRIFEIRRVFFIVLGLSIRLAFSPWPNASLDYVVTNRLRITWQPRKHSMCCLFKTGRSGIVEWF